MKPTLLKMARAGPICVLACSIAFTLPSCATRTVYIQQGEPVRLRQPIKQAKVWVADKTGKDVPGAMDLPEGWYCLPDPGGAGK